MFNYHSGLAWGRFWWKSLNPIWVILCQILPSNNCYFCLFNKKMVVPFLGPKMAPIAPKWHKMAWNDFNPLKLPPETISIGFLLLLRSFWVVTWPVYDHLEFKAKIGQKWPKRAPNDFYWRVHDVYFVCTTHKHKHTNNDQRWTGRHRWSCCLPCLFKGSVGWNEQNCLVI